MAKRRRKNTVYEPEVACSVAVVVVVAAKAVGMVRRELL